MTHTDRPASFDKAVMAFYPGLRNLARRYKSGAHYEDLVTDTIMRALENWRSYRAEGNMWRWLTWLMRGVVSNSAVTAKMQKRSGKMVPIDDVTLATEPRQEHYADVSAAVSRLHGRDGDVLLRRAMGEPLKDVCESHGISSERGRQLEARARRRLREASNV